MAASAELAAASAQSPRPGRPALGECVQDCAFPVVVWFLSAAEAELCRPGRSCRCTPW